MTVYAAPGTEGSLVTFRPRYDHWIGGEYVAPASGQYFENPSPVNGKVFCEVARGNDVDIERALDAAHAAAPAWGRLSVGERANVLKMKPPMCLTEASADFYVEMLDTVLRDGW